MPLHGNGSINRNFNCWTEPDENNIRDTHLEFRIISGVNVQEDKLFLSLDENQEPVDLQFQLKISKYHMGWNDRGGSGYHQKISGLYYREDVLLSATFPVDETILTSTINPTPYSSIRTFDASAIITMANGLQEDERPDSFILWPNSSIKMWNDKEIQWPIQPNSHKAPMFYEGTEFDRVFLPNTNEEDDETERETRSSTISIGSGYAYEELPTESLSKQNFQTIGQG